MTLFDRNSESSLPGRRNFAVFSYIKPISVLLFAMSTGAGYRAWRLKHPAKKALKKSQDETQVAWVDGFHSRQEEEIGDTQSNGHSGPSLATDGGSLAELPDDEGEDASGAEECGHINLVQRRVCCWVCHECGDPIEWCFDGTFCRRLPIYNIR